MKRDFKRRSRCTTGYLFAGGKWSAGRGSGELILGCSDEENPDGFISQSQKLFIKLMSLPTLIKKRSISVPLLINFFMCRSGNDEEYDDNHGDVAWYDFFLVTMETFVRHSEKLNRNNIKNWFAPAL